jgi:hypothetical protein
MAAEDSRKIPTMQAKSVGNFRLAESSGSSDKSAMPTHEEVRHILNQAFARKDAPSPITLAKDWELGRDYIIDFLNDRKNTLSYETLENLSEELGIPLNLLLIRRPKKKRKVA